MKSSVDRLISSLDIGTERISELEDVRETSQSEMQRKGGKKKKRKRWNKISKNSEAITKGITYT